MELLGDYKPFSKEKASVAADEQKLRENWEEMQLNRQYPIKDFIFWSPHHWW